MVLVLALAGAVLLAGVLLLPAEKRAGVASVVLRTPVGVLLGMESAGSEGADLVKNVVSKDVSLGVRREMLARALELLRRSLPWGQGAGGFAASVVMRDTRAYPHNILAEVWLENGWPGLLLLLGLLALLWRTAWKLTRAGWPDVRWVWALLWVALFNAQFSGDLPFNEGLWFWGGVLTAMGLASRHVDHGAGRRDTRAPSIVS
jgi:O-antigen ligase